MTTETTTSTSIALTDVAAAKVAALLAQEGRDDLYLRVAVQPGAQSGNGRECGELLEAWKFLVQCFHHALDQ